MLRSETYTDQNIGPLKRIKVFIPYHLIFPALVELKDDGCLFLTNG